jgi:hypothetical protein
MVWHITDNDRHFESKLAMSNLRRLETGDETDGAETAENNQSKAEVSQN